MGIKVKKIGVRAIVAIIMALLTLLGYSIGTAKNWGGLANQVKNNTGKIVEIEKRICAVEKTQHEQISLINLKMTAIDGKLGNVESNVAELKRQQQTLMNYLMKKGVDVSNVWTNKKWKR